MLNRFSDPLPPPKNNALPLYLQVYQSIRALILSGELQSGNRLPSTRHLAASWQVSRATVNEAYRLLIEEGFLITRRGAGTFVSDALISLIEKQKDATGILQLTNWGERAPKRREQESYRWETRPLIDFGFGRSYPHIFPYDIWRQMLGRYLSTDDVMLSRYGSVAGFMPLRQAIAAYVQLHRGVNCEPEQVVIVNGAQQALDLLSRLFIETGDTIIMESPGYVDAYELFQAHGANIVPIPVDQHGLPVDKLPTSAKPKLVFITPSNQFPKGGTMPAQRRLALLAWAEKKNAFIVEDDYDGPLRYQGHPLAAMQGIDPFGRVIYLGTFSKVLFPALRLAYVILPKPLLPSFVRVKRLIDRGSPTLTQAAVADFMLEGHFVRHLSKLRTLYGEVRQRLETAVSQNLGNHVQFVKEPAGLHLMLYLAPHIDEAAFITAAAEAGVRLSAGAPYHFHKPVPPSVLLGFSQLSHDEITEGVAILRTLLVDDQWRKA